MNSPVARIPRRSASICLLLGLAAAAAACKKPAPPPPVSLPVERVLLDASGRELPARIIGRAGEQITVERLSDGARFDLSLASLSPGDQAFLRGVADLAAPSAPAVPRVPSPYVQTRLDQIARLKEENERLRTETSATSNAMVKRRNLERVADNLAEIARMEAQLKARETEGTGRQ